MPLTFSGLRWMQCPPQPSLSTGASARRGSGFSVVKASGLRCLLPRFPRHLGCGPRALPQLASQGCFHFRPHRWPGACPHPESPVRAEPPGSLRPGPQGWRVPARLRQGSESSQPSRSRTLPARSRPEATPASRWFPAWRTNQRERKIQGGTNSHQTQQAGH